MDIKPQAVVIPKETDHLEQGKYGPIYPRTPACYGFTIIANVKPGKAEVVRNYGYNMAKALEEGVLEDDGADRGLMFAFVGAHLGRQFEFVQSQWINDGVFFGAGSAKDPIVGSNDDGGDFTVPRRPVRKRLQGLPRFVVTRGGEYCFMPGLRALRWLADLQT
jgi:hypothetical protein